MAYDDVMRKNLPGAEDAKVGDLVTSKWSRSGATLRVERVFPAVHAHTKLKVRSVKNPKWWDIRSVYDLVILERAE